MPRIHIRDNNDLHSYGCPDLGMGVKVGLHHQGKLYSHPDHIPRSTTLQDETTVRQVVERLMPLAAGPALQTRVCLYSNIPDGHYLIDYLHGHDRHAVIGSACSGHGFKMSCVVGEVLAALALDEAPTVDISPFRWRWPANHESILN